MLCENCQKNTATIHLTEIIDGQRSELHLCEFCASEQGIVVKSNIPINELLSNLLAAQPADDETADDESGLACPNCGFTLDQFRKENVFGCPNDYEVFAKAMLPLIKKAHDGHTVHRGKIPARTPANEKKQIQLASLRQQLDAAIQTEDYERAAKLRDTISALESDVGGPRKKSKSPDFSDRETRNETD